MLRCLSPPRSRYMARVLTLALAVPTFLTAASIQITAPSSKAMVAGIYTFSVDTAAAPAVDRVEYRLGSLSLGFATNPPFSLAWNSGLASDGNYALDVRGTCALSQPGGARRAWKHFLKLNQCLNRYGAFI